MEKMNITLDAYLIALIKVGVRDTIYGASAMQLILIGCFLFLSVVFMFL